MPVPTEGQILHWISDQVQRDTCLDAEEANHYAGGLLTGYRLGQVERAPIATMIEAIGLARLAIETDRAATGGTDEALTRDRELDAVSFGPLGEGRH